jgi:peroxiredoxin
MQRHRPTLFLALALTSLVAHVGAAEAPAKFGSLVPGAVAPDFTARDAEGRSVKLSAFRDKVVILNFWTTNRGPADALQSAFAQYGSLGLTVLGVCSNATRDEFDAWVKKNRDTVTYPLLWDPAGKTRTDTIGLKDFGLNVFPATGVIDREGKIVGGFIGFGAAAGPLLRDYLRTAGLAIAPEPEPARPAPAPPPEDRTLKPGTVAPDFANLDLAGKPVNLSDFAGKIVVLDFWATWCGPCIAAMPHTQTVAAATKAQGVVVLAACTSDTRAAFEGWLREHGGKYPDLIFVNDPHGRDTTPEKFAERASAKLYGVSGIPCQFVIGRDGTIVDVIRGYGPGDTRLEETLKGLGVRPSP